MERLLKQLPKIKRIITDEFVGVVTSMSGCSGIDSNLGHQLFGIYIHRDVTQLSYYIPFILNNHPPLHETCSRQRTLNNLLNNIDTNDKLVGISDYCTSDYFYHCTVHFVVYLSNTPTNTHI